MPARKGFSERAWNEIINQDMSGDWIDGMIEEARARPDDPFADVGPVLESILNKGVTKRDLCRVFRALKYETVFATVMLAAEENLDAEQLDAVHEELLSSDPSGIDGRPGSWPVKPPRAPKTAKASPAKSSKPSKSSKATGPKKSAPPADDGDVRPLLTLPKADDFAFSPDGARLWLAHTSVTSSTVRAVEIPAGGKPFAEFNSLPNLRGVAISPDARRLAATNHWGVVALHDALTGKELWRTPKTNEESHSIVYAPDGSMILSTGTGTGVRRHDAKTGKELAPLDFGEDWIATELALSHDGKTLAVAAVHVPGADHVSYWDWRTGKELYRHRHQGSISGVAFLPDNRSAVVGGYKEAHVRAVKTHASARAVKFDAGLQSISLHPAGRLLACHTSDGSTIHDLSTGKLLKKLDTKELYPWHFAFSPDGRHLLLTASPRSFLWATNSLTGPG